MHRSCLRAQSIQTRKTISQPSNGVAVLSFPQVSQTNLFFGGDGRLVEGGLGFIQRLEIKVYVPVVHLLNDFFPEDGLGGRVIGDATGQESIENLDQPTLEDKFHYRDREEDHRD